jgi:hypothetical protein
VLFVPFTKLDGSSTRISNAHVGMAWHRLPVLRALHVKPADMKTQYNLRED